MRRKKIFIVLLILALLLHTGGIFLLHKLPLTLASFAIKKIGSDAIIGEANQDAWVMELFDTLKPEITPVKENLKDLHPENVPFNFCFPESCDLKIADPTFPELEGFDLDPFTDFSYIEEEKSPPLEIDQSGAFVESDHFHVHVEYTSRRLHPGYLFKITLTPKQQIAFRRIRENYFFLIDRSNSILRARYYYNKKAISELLGLLKPGDTFNILIFDDRVVRLSPRPLTWNENNVAIARAFLEQESHGGLFSASDIYTSLWKILPQAGEMNTAFLLSDGDTYLPMEKQRRSIGAFCTANAGRVTLFSVACRSGNHLPLLELLSTFNKGELLYVSKPDQISEKLKQLFLSLQNPIGKNCVATAISQDEETVVYLQPKASRLPDLYKNRPYTIFGFTNQLTPFTLFLQGTYYDRTFDIKKLITFDDAKSGTLFLEKEWTELIAQEHYEKFFHDGKPAHIEAAKELLAPLNVSVPFLK